MSLKLKALSLGLLAALAMSSLLVANAGATRSGHFTSDSTTTHAGGVPTTTLVGEESMSDFKHKIEFSSTSLGGISPPIYCTNALFHGTVTGATTQEIKIKPTYSECTKTGGGATHVNFNGCEYKFTSRTEPGDATAGLVCPPNKKVTLEITGSCTLSFGPQTVANAVTYETAFENNKHAITLRATGANITFTAHKGPCIFLPTTINDGTLTGGATVQGFDTAGFPVNITAT